VLRSCQQKGKGCGYKEEIMKKSEYEKKKVHVINVDGSVGPCCLYDVPSWGNALDLGFMNVWNNEIFREARLRSHLNKPEPKRHIVCDSCKAPFIYKH
jgi:MoaA/NifB/PqqE/SkfB family radical SAM enzyme